MSKTAKPRTEAQRAAARANGAKSHGPVTPEGKAASALNALRHGLAAGTVVLNVESDEMFRYLLTQYNEEYQPQGQTELDLVEELVVAKWFQRRCWSYMKSLLDLTAGRMQEELSTEFISISNTDRAALAFLRQVDQSQALTLLNRYAARHGREYHRALDKLRQIQQNRDREVQMPALPPVKLDLPNEPEPEQPAPNQEPPRPHLVPPPPTAPEQSPPYHPAGPEE